LREHRERPSAAVLLVGAWHAMPPGPAVATIRGTVVAACADGEDVSRRAAIARPTWLLAGGGLDDCRIQSSVSATRATCPEARLAILGPPDDWKRCERWVRRGCAVYLTHGTSANRVLSALAQSRRLDATIVDRAYYHLLESRRAVPAPSLTRREEEVLDLLCRGLRNRDIAHALHVSENTVEFHVRHLLTKLGARSRLEAVERATAFALV